MRILLDTNALLRFAQGWPGMPAAVRQTIADHRNEVFVSSVSAAEIALKVSIGILTPLPSPLHELMSLLDLTELPFTIAHAEQLMTLPWHHKDPFDRMLIAQALVDDLPVVTSDRIFADYGVRVI